MSMPRGSIAERNAALRDTTKQGPLSTGNVDTTGMVPLAFSAFAEALANAANLGLIWLAPSARSLIELRQITLSNFDVAAQSVLIAVAPITMMEALIAGGTNFLRWGVFDVGTGRGLVTPVKNFFLPTRPPTITRLNSPAAPVTATFLKNIRLRADETMEVNFNPAHWFDGRDGNSIVVMSGVNQRIEVTMTGQEWVLRGGRKGGD